MDDRRPKECSRELRALMGSEATEGPLGMTIHICGCVSLKVELVGALSQRFYVTSEYVCDSRTFSEHL
jgi:hypothetical protein